MIWIIGISIAMRLLFIGMNDLLVEEAYYWNYAQHLDFSYLDHPPMVAVLIKVFTSIFGTNEFAIRIGSLFCWALAAVFSFKLSNLIYKGSGLFAVGLMSILPFFFLQSITMTPDQPLIVCWAAALYFLYQALVLEKPKAWYIVGICLGLGLLSKYSIVLLGLASLIYVGLMPHARQWFIRKEPYIGVLLATLLFIPVVYWNANHEWVSFIFQGSRRFQAVSHFSLHKILGLLLFFLLPVGLWGFLKLFHKKTLAKLALPINTQRFLQVYTLVPLLFFGFFSLNHAVKFNWIGPSLLAVIPWLAALIAREDVHERFNLKKIWVGSGVPILLAYGFVMVNMTMDTHEVMQKKALKKYMSWSNLTQSMYKIAQKVEEDTHTTPVFVPLDAYNIGSELAFYQAKSLKNNKNAYAIVGRHIFGLDSLMYYYWSDLQGLKDKTLILVAREKGAFKYQAVTQHLVNPSEIHKVWAYSQGLGAKVTPYYYQVAKFS